MYEEDSDDFYDYEDDEYMSMDPIHGSTYQPLFEPSQQPIEELRFAVETGKLKDVLRLVNILSPPIQNAPLPSHANGDNEEEQELDEDDEMTASDKNAPPKREEVVYSNGWTPLIQAAHLGLHEVVSSLLKEGFDVNYKTKGGPSTTALIASCSTRRIKQQSTPQQDQNRPQVNHDKVVELLLAGGSDVTTVSDICIGQEAAPDNSAIHFAAINGRYRAVELLVEAGANVNARNKLDRTPLMLAAERGHLRTVNSLLGPQCNALPALEDRAGSTASYLASLNGHSQLADSLAVLSGEAARDDRLYKAWWMVKESLAKGDTDESQVIVGGRNRYNDYDELASFCYGLEIGHVLPVLRQQGVKMADLKRMNDSRLKEIGVDKFQDRKKILDLVQEMHKRPWKDETSLPKFDYGKPLKPSDLINMMGNTARHLEFMDATVSYLDNHVTTNRSLYIKEAANVPESIISRLQDQCEESLQNCQRLHQSLISLRLQAAVLQCHTVEDIHPDLVLTPPPPSSSLQRIKSRLSFYSSRIRANWGWIALGSGLTIGLIATLIWNRGGIFGRKFVMYVANRLITFDGAVPGTMIVVQNVASPIDAVARQIARPVGAVGKQLSGPAEVVVRQMRRPADMVINHYKGPKVTLVPEVSCDDGGF